MTEHEKVSFEANMMVNVSNKRELGDMLLPSTFDDHIIYPGYFSSNVDIAIRDSIKSNCFCLDNIIDNLYDHNYDIFYQLAYLEANDVYLLEDFSVDDLEDHVSVICGEISASYYETISYGSSISGKGGYLNNVSMERCVIDDIRNKKHCVRIFDHERFEGIIGPGDYYGSRMMSLINNNPGVELYYGHDQQLLLPSLVQDNVVKMNDSFILLYNDELPALCSSIL